MHAPRRPPSSSRAARTNRTARSFNSGGYFLNFGILLILPGSQEPPPDPGHNRHVHVTIPVLTLAGVSRGPAIVPGHGPVDTDTARRLAAKAPRWERVMTDPYTGAVLAVDRYRVPADLSRFLRARDERRRFPGCGRTVGGCDVDHTHDAALGGTTSAGNLAHLCRRHHTLKHHTAWPVRQLGDGVLEWTAPTGRHHLDRPPATVRFVPADAEPPPT
ncbi:MAG: HNH endonuclease signature motif containing protein [Microbacterium sp.]